METVANHVSATETVPKLVELLSKLSPTDRQRALSATMILLGDQLPSLHEARVDRIDAQPVANATGISPRASIWTRKHLITQAQLEHVFSISADGIDVIASNMPADSKRQQTIEAYLMCGIADLLRNGDGKFSDLDARDLCRKVGCYDKNNHTGYMKAAGNLLGGNKDTGWKLTNPGLERAAKIIQQLAPAT